MPARVLFMGARLTGGRQNNVTINDFKTVVSECFCNLSKMQPFWDVYRQLGGHP